MVERKRKGDARGSLADFSIPELNHKRSVAAKNGGSTRGSERDYSRAACRDTDGR